MESIKKFSKVIENHQKIGIDSSIFIYKFEQNPTYEPFCSLIFNLLTENKIHLITSIITASEVLVKPFEKKKNDIVHIYETLFNTLPNFSLVKIDYQMAKTAAFLRASYKIFLPDAYQIAAALKENASIFITNDLRLNQIKEIKTVCLKEFT